MATAYKDYYATLGVPRTASQKDIKSAFRKLARKHHPDLNPADGGAEARFKEVNEANEVLSDPEKRKKYDELGPEWERQVGGGSSAGVEYRSVSPEELEEMFGEADPFSDFFHSMFGRSGPPRPGGGRAKGAGPARG